MENLPDILEILEEFMYKLSGWKKTSDLKVLRYFLFCAKRGEVQLYQLPPYQNCLQNKFCVLSDIYIYMENLPFLMSCYSFAYRKWLTCDDQNKLSIDLMNKNLATDSSTGTICLATAPVHALQNHVISH